MRHYKYYKVNPFPLIVVLCLALSGNVMAGEKGKLRAIGFYNVENLFDTTHDEGKLDEDFLPEGRNEWTPVKYSHKLANISAVLAEMATDKVGKQGCDIIGLAEVENSHVIDDLIAQEPLRKRGYKYCHIEGPDMRGIDCALLYNPKKFKLRDVKLVPYIQELKQDSAFRTRGFLTVSGTYCGEHLTVVVCHLPSRGSTEFYRRLGARQIKALRDSLLSDDPQLRLIVMGDMNDDPDNASMAKCLGAKRKMKDVGDGDFYNPWWDILRKDGQGTLSYQGGWNLFDQIVLSKNLLDTKGTKEYKNLTLFRYHIFKRDYLMQQEGKYKGTPKRTTSSGVWLNGYSDHLPTVTYLVKR